MVNYTPNNRFKNNMEINNKIDIKGIDDNEYDFNYDLNNINNLNQGKNNISKNKNNRNRKIGYNLNINDKRMSPLPNQNFDKDNKMNMENVYLIDYPQGNNNFIDNNINNENINSFSNKADIYNSLLENIKQLSNSNSENKKSVISLQSQYNNFQKMILSKISEFLSTSKLNYNTKLQNLNLQ